MKNTILFGLIALLMILNGSACTKNSSSSTPALEITAKDIWFSDAEDLDDDGYVSYMKLNLDLDVNRSSLEVVVEVYVRLHDPADTAGYYPYFQSGAFAIGSDGTDDAVYISIGDPNIQLPQAEWDFGILVYNAGDPEEPVLGFDYSAVSAFSAVAIEEEVTDGGIIIYDAWWFNNEDIDNDGYNSKASLGVDVDVPNGLTTDVYLDLFVKTAASSNYTYFGSTDFFAITGDSENDAVGINFDDTFGHNEYDFRITSMVYNGDVIEDMVDKSTSGFIGEELGNVPLELASEDEKASLTVSFTNQIFTPINILILNYGSRTIPVGGSVDYVFDTNPGSIRVTASTSGKTDAGTQIGELVSWQYTLNVTGQTELTYNLTLSSSMFYMYMQNTGTKDLTPIYVNYGLADQIIESDFHIPPDNIKYDIGYYKAFTNTEVRAYYSGEPASYTYWQQGVHFTLPFTQNQSVTLINPFKNGKTTPTAIIHIGNDALQSAGYLSAKPTVK